MWRREKPPLSKREQRSQNIMEQIRDKASTLSKNAQVCCSFSAMSTLIVHTFHTLPED
jgi:hypothetical protein